MIWIGTSGWAYDHWIGTFYPPDLSKQRWLRYYARHFSTVEINRSFYRLPSREQFASWATQAAAEGEFLFAVKASRYITHLKKLNEVGDALQRLAYVAEGLDSQLGPFLYQLPPHWTVNPERLASFIGELPAGQRAAFEFRDPSWYRPDVISMLERSGSALVIAVGGSLPTPLDLPPVGSFRYVRIHGGTQGIGLTDDELEQLAHRLSSGPAADTDAYVYFNNDPEGYAVRNALRLRDMLGTLAR